MKTLLAVILILGINSSYGQWEQQSFPTDEYLWKVGFFDQETGWVLGLDFIYKSDDGGQIWKSQNSRSGYGVLYVSNRDTVIYSGEDSTGRYSIYRTHNGGTDWDIVDTSGFFINEIEFVDNQIGYAIGGTSADPGIIKTINGGTTWEILPDSFSTDGREITGVSFVDPLEGWLVSYRAFVYHTTNGGLTWVLQDSIRNDNLTYGWLPLRDIEFTTADSGWAAGGISGSAYIVQTTDGGITWSDSVLGGGSIREIHFLDSYTGWTAGNYNFPPYIWHTQNGGNNWYGQQIVSQAVQFSGVESISMINKNLGWAVGGDGIIKTSSGNVVGIKEQISTSGKVPSEYLLEQNYPNPFNPSTSIEFSLARSGLVEISVYNYLGQKIITILNEKRNAGRHKVIFNAGNLAAGLYYYRLKTDHFTEIKKMVLIK